jgi:phosphoserine phosphatase
MEGKLPIEAVYSERMGAIRPALAEIEELARVYVECVAPRARETLAELRARGIELVMVSGGLREAILPLAGELGVDEQRVHAVSVFFDDEGEYAGFDEQSPLTRQDGKRITVRDMGLRGPILAVGDGMTDCEIRQVVEGFAAFTGFMRRESVVQRADFVIENFDELRELVLE